MKIKSSPLCRVLLLALWILLGLQIQADADGVSHQPIVPAEGQEGALSGAHQIEASAGPHGSISPAGVVTVKDTADQIFAITPEANYYVADVLVDGSPAGAVTVYKFSDVTGNHTISATFLPCIYSLVRKKQDVGASGGSFSFDITVSDISCGWSAVSDNQTWISTASSGRSNGTVVYTIQANAGPARTGYITVEGRRFTIDQESGCSYKLDRVMENVGASGGSYGFRVTSSDSACAWTASSNNPSWISTAVSGAGNGIASFTVSANAGPARSGSLSIGGQNFAVNQESGCTFELSPASGLVSAKPGNYSFTITASDSGCAWKAISNNPSWITTSVSGAGNSTVSYSVLANTGPERSSSISVGGRTFSVNQGNGCFFTFDPASSDAGIEAGFYGFAVSASDSSCAWKATSDSPSWISTSSTGTANGTAGYSLSANVGPARTGSIFIGEQGFTIRQASGCSFSLTPKGDSIPSTGGDFSFTMNTSDKGCAWSAKSNEPAWIATTSSGTGNGTVKYAVAANPGLTRIGSLTAGGQNFILSQGNGCRYKLNQTSSDVGPSAGNYNVAISASDSACPWTTASNNPSWITVSGSGTGDGAAGYMIQAYEGPERTGSITVGGQILTIRQASGCRYKLSKTGSDVGPSAGSYTVAISTSDGACPWTATSNNPAWITSSSSGSGNGTVTYTIQPNVGPERTGSLVVGGQTFKVAQGNGCSFTLNPARDSISPSGGSHSFNIVASAPDCPWTATSDNTGWVATESRGAGDGTITYTADANHQAARKGLISVGGQSFAVYQASGINYSLTVNKSGSGSGTVSSSETPPFISCDGGCSSASAQYIDGTAARLKATPDASSFFNGWSGACSGSGDCSVKVDTNKSVAAAFIRKVRMVHAHAGEGGSISPFTQAARHGETMRFTVTPHMGHHIVNVTGCGITHYRSSSEPEVKKKEKAGGPDLLAAEVYITAPITADCSVKAEFAPDSFTVTPFAGEHGSISTSIPQRVGYNDTVRFTVKADAEYHIESVSGCGGNDYSDAGKSKTDKNVKSVTEYAYTTGKVTHDCTATAKFAINTYTVTPKAERHGSLDPSTPQSVNRLDMISFTITPDPGYHIASVSGCGGEFISEDEYVTGSITENCTVSAAFRLDMHLLTVRLSGTGSGTVSAGGLTCDGRTCKGSFEHGKKVVLRIKPDTGSRVADVKIDGSTIGARKTASIAEVESDHNVDVVFAPLQKK